MSKDLNFFIMYLGKITFNSTFVSYIFTASAMVYIFSFAAS